MKNEIKIPSLGESIAEATIGRILKNSGSRVTAEDEILELETDKVNQVIYANFDGVLTLNVNSGDIVKIGQKIGDIEEVAEKEGTQKEISKEEPIAKAHDESKELGNLRRSQQEFVEQLQAKTPKVTQEQSSSRKEQASSEAPKKERAINETRKKMSSIRKVIAKRMVDSLHQSAMLTTFNEVDMTEITSLRTKYKEEFQKKYNLKLGLMPFFVLAVLEALKLYPELNAYIDEDDIVYRNYFNIGVAVGTDRGLVVPVIKSCDQLVFAAIEKEIEEFAEKARSSRLTIENLQGGGFTITNGGVYGSLLSTPILNPPQSGILGIHKITKRAVVVDDQIVIRPMMNLALSYDHRIVDGREAVSFLVKVKEILEDPSRLMFINEAS